MKQAIKFALASLFLLLALDWILLLVTAQATMPTSYYPSTSAPRPWTWLKNDLTRLKTAFADPNNAAAAAFKHDLNKLMTYSTHTQDWRWQSGWPCAALALAWRLTGDPSYADKAINVFLSYFTGVPTISGRLQSVTHFAYCYDWLYDYSGFTSSAKTTLRNKLINWSDQEFASDTDTSNPSYIGQDSDHLTASTTSHIVAGVAIYGDDPAAVTLLNRGWIGWTVGYNNNPTTLPTIAIETMYSVGLENGHPLPGWG